MRRQGSHVLTHLADGEGALVAGAHLAGTTSGEVEEFDQSGNHLVLLLGMTKTTVASEAPAEDPLLGVQHQLQAATRGGQSSATGPSSSYFWPAHRVIGPARHVSDHHVGHRHDLAVLGLLDEDGHAARDGLAVELDALGTSDELAVAVVTCERRRSVRPPPGVNAPCWFP